MEIAVKDLHPGNIGQVVIFDTADYEESEHLVITGQLEAIAKTTKGYDLTVGGEPYEFEPDEMVSINRSSVLSKLTKLENNMLTEESLAEKLLEAVESGSDFRVLLAEAVRDAVEDVLRAETVGEVA